MQLVFVHYHLNRGGVTRVVENHLRAIATQSADKQPSRVVILYGGRAAAWGHAVTDALPFEVKLVTIPELDYDNETSAGGQLHHALQDHLAKSGYSKASTVLHIHNHSLGKNAALPRAIGQLANDGWRMLLQIHDFAEDLRPANYQHLLADYGSLDQLQRQLYPQASQIHYAVLNGRDFDVLAEAGMHASHLHLLPNAVNVDKQPATQEQSKAARAKLAEIYGVPHERGYVLYPVRAIRRKNLGEFFLWSLLVDDATFAVTLAPLNPQELPSYEAWVAFATSLQLPVLFGVGGDSGLSLDENYAAASAVMTTSVAEGFGLVYLEATLAGRHLAGRGLPGITDDFYAAGMRFPGLDDVLHVPRDWLDLPELKRMYLKLSLYLQTAFGLPPQSTEALSESIEEHFAGDTVDFGRLDSATQRKIIGQVRVDTALQRILRELNPIVDMVRGMDDDELQSGLATNRQVIERCYSLNVIGSKLCQLYELILASTPEKLDEQSSIARSILDSFVRPSRLFPIRVES